MSILLPDIEKLLAKRKDAVFNSSQSFFQTSFLVIEYIFSFWKLFLLPAVLRILPYLLCSRSKSEPC